MKNVGFVFVLDLLIPPPPPLTSSCNVVFANEGHVLLISNNDSQIIE